MNPSTQGQEGPRSDLDSMISTTGIPTQRVEHNAVLKNVGNVSSRRLAIKAMCFHCMGCTEDHYEYGVKDDIRNCTSPMCPLWHFRPYQTKGPGGEV
jgi:hypothetical protein